MRASFADTVKNDLRLVEHYGTTDNGAPTLVSSMNKCVDLYGLIGSSRQNPDQAVRAFSEAFAEDRVTASKILLHARDVRGGMGERKIFRTILETNESRRDFLPFLERIIPVIPEVGRWDDMLIFSQYEAKRLAFAVIRNALFDKNGLCAKWMPRKGDLAVELRQTFGLSPKQYRKMLVGLTNVVETKMCDREWTNINYDHVPSVAAARYQKTFNRHDPEGYAQYRQGLIRTPAGAPTRTIHANAIYPHDVIKGMLYGDAAVGEAQWDALPNWIPENTSIVPMIDVSGSMKKPVSDNLNALTVAMSIGLYFASKQTGAYKDLALTFSGTPEWIQLNGGIRRSLSTMSGASWMENTNIQAAFDKILEVAVGNRLTEAQMPKMLVIVSDMEFDRASPPGGTTCWSYGFGNRGTFSIPATNFSVIRSKFARHGYTMPRLVFWNVCARAGNSPVRFDEQGVALVSGFSTNLVKSILSNKIEDYSPASVMMEALSDPRYDVFGDLY